MSDLDLIRRSGVRDYVRELIHKRRVLAEEAGAADDEPRAKQHRAVAQDLESSLKALALIPSDPLAAAAVALAQIAARPRDVFGTVWFGADDGVRHAGFECQVCAHRWYVATAPKEWGHSERHAPECPVGAYRALAVPGRAEGQG